MDANNNEQQLHEVFNLVLCHECGRMFYATALEQVVDEDLKPKLLPCGHKASEITFSGSAFKDGLRAEKMLRWLDNNRFIMEEAGEGAKLAGGSFNSINKFDVPLRDLTCEELEEFE
jgi:hypothetical protein